jgi:hypothetical protein
MNSLLNKTYKVIKSKQSSFDSFVCRNRRRGFVGDAANLFLGEQIGIDTFRITVKNA